MTHVVTDNCIKCKYTDCVEVCPVDCFHEGPNFLAIDPQICIDCTLCIAECPADAIFSPGRVPPEQAHFFEINAELAKRWPVLDAPIKAPEDAGDWNGVINKLQHLDRSQPNREAQARPGLLARLSRLGKSGRDQAV